MKQSLCDDFLNGNKIFYPFLKYGYEYINGRTDFMPWAVEIHPTARCNHSCIHCSYKERNENRAEMPKEMFDILIDSIIRMKVHGVYFSGGGEPCAYPGLADAIRKLGEAGVETALVSNGSLIESKGITDVADKLNYIALSVPSCDPAKFEHITGRPNLEKVLALPQKIKSRFGENAPVIGSRVVVTNLIADEVLDILTTLKEKDFDYVLFKIVRDYESRGLGVSDEEAGKLQSGIEKLKKEGGIDHRFTNIDRIFDFRKKYTPDGLCHVSRMGLLAVITPEGEVYQNISEIGKSDFLVGSLKDDRFENIWNSEQHKRVKELSDKQWASGQCANCRSISYNVRLNEMLGSMPSAEDPFV